MRVTGPSVTNELPMDPVDEVTSVDTSSSSSPVGSKTDSGFTNEKGGRV